MSTHVDTNFSEWLIAQMKSKDWSQSDLARASGLTRQAISYYLSDKSKSPDENALIKIAYAFHVSPVIVFRKAGLLPENNGADVKLDDWEFLLKQMSPEDEAELRQIAEMKIERRKRDQSLKTLKPKKVG